MRYSIQTWLLVLAFVVSSTSASSQERLNPADIASPAGALAVRVRSGGAPLDTMAVVRIYSKFSAVNLTATTQDMGQAIFRSVPLGNYILEVSAAGYLTTVQETEITVPGMTATIVVELRPEGSPGGSISQPADKLVLAPKARKELDKAVEAIRRKRWKEAEELLARVAKLAPGHPDVYYLLAVVMLETNFRADAQRHLRKALQLYPDHVPSLLSLASLLVEEKNYPNAIESLQRVIQVNPESGPAYELLAVAHLEQQDFARAREYAARALELSRGNSPQLHFLLGAAYAGLGERGKAKEELETFLQRTPNHTSAPEARRLISSLNPTPTLAPVGATSAPPIHVDLPLEALPISREFLAPPARWPITPVDEFRPPIRSGPPAGSPRSLKA